MAVMINDCRVYTTAEAAARLGVSARRVRQFCHEGRLGLSVGPVYLISANELKNFGRRKRPVGRPPSK